MKQDDVRMKQAAVHIVAALLNLAQVTRNDPAPAARLQEALALVTRKRRALARKRS